MKKKTQKQLQWKCIWKDSIFCAAVLFLFLLLTGIFYYAAGEQLYWRTSRAVYEYVPSGLAAPEPADGAEIRQEFLCRIDRLQRITVPVTAFARENHGILTLEVWDETDGRRLAADSWEMQTLAEEQQLECSFDDAGTWGHVISIRLVSDGTMGTCMAPWLAALPESGTAAQIEEGNSQLFYQGMPIEGKISFGAYGKDKVWTGFHFFEIAAVLLILLAAGCIRLIVKKNTGKKSWLLDLAALLRSYRFLLKQLVARDFKIKYKRSVLGVLWSFVNPLLVMCVQYVVFSTIFRSDLEHYQVYLLSGIVLFNFFSESSNVGMYAISGNAGLITKVYVPKYIYPVSKVLSTCVNLLISLLPLVVITVASGVRVTKAWLLLPFILLCLLVFCCGIALLLSAALVFFRDIQFIWSVLLMVLTYATPVFYPESILPQGVREALQWNPMYHFVTFFRMLVMDGISPEPMMYVQCAAFAGIFLLVGAFVFARTQDRFIFYL